MPHRVPEVLQAFAAGADYVTVTRISDAQELYEVIAAVDNQLLDDKRTVMDGLLHKRREVLP